MINDKETPKSRLRYIVIGAGMAGLLAGIRLLEAGETRIEIYEKGDSVGGTWRENHYPGLTCDVPAHSYTYSFAPNPDWSAFYAGGPEIHDYFKGIATKYDLDRFIHLNTEIKRCDFIDGEWQVTLDTGEVRKADVVIAATGVLHYPNIPNFEGIESFAGKVMHSARWEDDVPLDGRRVAVIGGGSTGVQIVSALAGRARSLVHFQRSPQWIVPVKNFVYTDEQRAEFRNDVKKIDAIRYGEEYWGGVHRFNAAIIDPDSPQMAEITGLVEANLEENIQDPVLREKLRPDYKPACKRLIYSGEYYEAVQRPNVIVERGKIGRFEAGGIRMQDGALYLLDVVALATGFKADRFVRPIKVTGRNGRKLDDVWEKRPKAYLALTVPDFPNFFLLNGPTGPVGNFSLIDIAERQWMYIDQLLDKLRKSECAEIAVREEVLADYEQRRIQAAQGTVFASGCTSWYLDAEGVPATWPWSFDHFNEVMRTPAFEEFEMR